METQLPEKENKINQQTMRQLGRHVKRHVTNLSFRNTQALLYRIDVIITTISNIEITIII